MGAIAIVIWMLVIMPIAIVVAGLVGSLGLDYAFERINKPTEVGGEDSGDSSTED